MVLETNRQIKRKVILEGKIQNGHTLRGFTVINTWGYQCLFNIFIIQV